MMVHWSFRSVLLFEMVAKIIPHFIFSRLIDFHVTTIIAQAENWDAGQWYDLLHFTLVFGLVDVVKLLGTEFELLKWLTLAVSKLPLKLIVKRCTVRIITVFCIAEYLFAQHGCGRGGRLLHEKHQIRVVGVLHYVVEVDSVKHLVFGLQHLLKTEVVMPFFQSVESDLFVMLGEDTPLDCITIRVANICNRRFDLLLFEVDLNFGKLVCKLRVVL